MLTDIFCELINVKMHYKSYIKYQIFYYKKKTRLEKIIKTCCKNYIKVNYNIIVCKKMCKELYNNDIIIVIIIND